MTLVKKIAMGYRVDMTENKVLEEIKEVFDRNRGEFSWEFEREVPEFVYLKLTLEDGHEYRNWFYTDGDVAWIIRKPSPIHYDLYKCYLANASYIVHCYTWSESGAIVEFGIGVYGDCPFSDAIRTICFRRWKR
jgi:hypothetical protein